MSDFLTRIARLTRGEATAVKPRLPGHFAPLPETPTAEPLDGRILAPAADGRGKEPVHAQRQTAPGPAIEASGDHPGGQVAETVKAQTVDTNTAAHAPGTLPIDAKDEVTPQLAPAGMPQSPEAFVDTDDRRPLAGMDWAAPEFDFSGDAETPTGPSRQDNEGDPVSIRESGTAVQTTSLPFRPKLLVRTQPAAREEAGVPDFPEAPLRTRSEPVVHVNIGRIEVRASTPDPRQQPRPAPARQQSSVSLQDYLARGQTGGKRT